uniref:Nuclear receptor domain-containing protein n=1 Tax=Panagrellus redivivus TaxID=6233 RepID=A0A7E4VD70_PANRE
MNFRKFDDDLFDSYVATTDESGVETGSSNVVGTEPCTVCGANARGLHFQVVSCRACAAFFRRSVRNKRVYRCRTGFRDCDLTKTASGKPICRFCRLKKCYDVGMRLETAAASTSGGFSPPTIASSTAGSVRQQPSSSNDTSPPLDRTFNQPILGNRLMLDFRHTIATVKGILNSNVALHIPGIPNGVHHTPLQEVQYAFAAFRSKVCPPAAIEPVATYDKTSFYPFMEKYCQHVAEMFMSCRQFASLPYEDKFRLYKRAWNMIHTLERMYSTVVIYGSDLNDNRQVFTNTMAIDTQKTGVYATNLDPKKFQELMNFCFPLKQHIQETMLVPMKQIRLTHFEFSYMIIYIMFNVHDFRDLSPSTIRAGEQLLDQFCTELHNYYTLEVNMPNYASRITKMHTMIAAAKQHSSNIKDYMIMAKVFDIFICNWYECELFD